MDAATAALIGAGIGAIGPFVTSLLSLLVDGRRHRLELTEGRDTRLFEHRREAYLEMITASQTALRASLISKDEDTDEAREQFSAAVGRLLFLHGRVSLYGTATAAELSDKLWDAVVALRNASKDNRHTLFVAAVKALDAFTAQARADLGVPPK